MDILGLIGYGLLVTLAAIWTLAVRTKLDVGSDLILGALFLLSGAVALTLTDTAKAHALWIIPAGYLFTVLMVFLSAYCVILFLPFRVLASLFVAIVRVGIPAQRIRAAQEAGRSPYIAPEEGRRF
jgi:hypothetical protein